MTMQLHAGDIRVLVADDQEDSRSVLAVFFRLRGYRVRAAADGQEALEIAREFRPDIVFLDWWMPRMTGLEACYRMREGPCPPSVPIYAVTADATVVGTARCFTDVLLKPLDLESLEQLITGTEAARAEQQSPSARPS